MGYRRTRSDRKAMVEQWNNNFYVPEIKDEVEQKTLEKWQVK